MLCVTGQTEVAQYTRTGHTRRDSWWLSGFHATRLFSHGIYQNLLTHRHGLKHNTAIDWSLTWSVNPPAVLYWTQFLKHLQGLLQCSWRC